MHGVTQTLKNKPENLTCNKNLVQMKIRLQYPSKHENLMIYQYFWFDSAFLDAGQKFSPSARVKPEILTQNKTNITNMLG